MCSATALLQLAVGVSLLGPGGEEGVLIAPLGLGLGSPTGSAQGLLPFSSGSQTTPRGLVSVSWTTVAGAPPLSPTCDKKHEAQEPALAYAHLNCSDSSIAEVQFVSFGTPSGECGGSTPFAINRACDSPTAPSFVREACVGKASCSIPVNMSILGDACPGTSKWLSVNATCASPPPPPPPTFYAQLNASVPVSLAHAAVRLPLFAGVDVLSVVVTEGGVAVWRNGSFAAGVVGVNGGKSVQTGGGGVALEFSVGSGDFSFTVM